jgi:hypothetical protein
MKINIELNSNELDSIVNDTDQPIEYNFLIDLYTESRTEISSKEETAILSSLFWALCTMLPYTIIHSLFKKWNDLVIELQEGLHKGDNVIIKQYDDTAN